MDTRSYAGVESTVPEIRVDTSIPATYAIRRNKASGGPVIIIHVHTQTRTACTPRKGAALVAALQRPGVRH